MAKKTYRVVGSHAVMGNAPGNSFTVSLSPEQEAYYVNAGHLALGEGEDKEPPAYPCPRCKWEKKKSPPKFAAQSELAEHYQEKHPGLVAPTLGEEE